MAAPIIWNQLPIAIKSSVTIDTFRKKLKTYLKFFHHRILAVPCSNDDFCLSSYMTSKIILFVEPLSLNIFQDLGTIEVLQLLFEI